MFKAFLRQNARISLFFAGLNNLKQSFFLMILYLSLLFCAIGEIQLYECAMKLRNPPISTHSYYDLNDTIELPAITICRDPPYKEDVLTNLSGDTCQHPKYNTCWDKYPFGEVPLDVFFEDSTFDDNETFLQFGLDGWPENLEVTYDIHFYNGRCYTLRPKKELNRVGIKTGYSFMLKHHVVPDEDTYIEYERPGWHLYIHDHRENFTEINMKGSGRVEYVFAEINEDIEIKLQSQYFQNIEAPDNLCSNVEGYSDLKCGEVCIWQELAKNANCTGPWMAEVSQEYCNDNVSVKNLISQYIHVYDNEVDVDCDCKQPCKSRLFTTYIQNRKFFTQPNQSSTQIYIYYTTKLISMIEERPSYDTTQFIADIGGSLGFLLGLSVLGIIVILENLTLFFCGGLIKKVQLKSEKNSQKGKSDDQSSQQSDETVDVATVHKLTEPLNKV